MARRAAAGDSTARAQVTTLAHPIITYQTNRFCKRFCYDNRYLYICTLASPWGSPSPDAPLCEWGNASYAWMLEDLTSSRRLRRYEGKRGASLYAFFFSIANSLPFYERWKDWRFGRRVHVPACIQDIGPDAGKVFRALRSGDSTPLIAQKLGMHEDEADKIVQRVVIELTRRRKLYLLEPRRTVSLDAEDSASAGASGLTDSDLPWEGRSPEQEEENRALMEAWEKLSPVEQFVLEAMLVNGQDALAVLGALKRLGIALNDRIAASNTDRQQLYYFRRRALAKLAKLAGYG
jgi:hypothetical protein